MNQELIKQFHEAWKGLCRKKKINVFDGQLYRSEFFLLVTVEEYCESNEKGIKPSELAEMLDLSLPAVSKQIKAVEDKGYIERRYCTDDKRMVYITISPKGKELLDKGKEERNREIEMLIEHMGEEKVKEFISLAKDVSAFFNGKEEK